MSTRPLETFADQLPLLPGLLARVLRPSVRQGVVVLVDQGLCSLASFLTGVLVARACTRADYGLFVLALTMLRTVESIHESIVSAPLTVFSARLEGRERAACFGSALVHHVGLSALAALALGAASGLLAAFGGSSEMAWILLTLAAASAAFLMRDFVRFALLAQCRVWASLGVGLAVSVSTVAVLLWLYGAGRLTVPGACLAVAACSGLPSVAALWLTRDRLVVLREQVARDLGRSWRFGRWLLARSLAYFPAVLAYPWALAAMKGADAAGLYGACLGLAYVVNPVFMGLNSYAGPRAAHAAPSGAAAVRRTIGGAAGAALLLVVPLVLGALLWGERALTAVYKSAYAGGGPVLLVCTLAVGVSMTSGLTVSGFNALGRPDIPLWGRLVGAAITCTAGLLLIWVLGPLGAALGLLASNVACSAWWLFQFARLTAPLPVGAGLWHGET